MQKNISHDVEITEEKTSFPVSLVMLIGVMAVAMAILGLKLFEVI